MPDRAVLYIDGNNWYHACKARGVEDLFILDYVKISQKLVAPREWRGSRYYIGALKQTHRGYREQRQFLSRLGRGDGRITVHLGRIEERPRQNELASALLRYLQDAPHPLPLEARQQLEALANQYRLVSLLKEKAADIQLAVDMVRMAVRDEFDAAYLLSADGDFTPAIQAVREQGKKVYAVSPSFSAALNAAANAFIPLERDWFRDCY